MIIDFHVHCFPDELAKRAIPLLSERAKLRPNSDGTIEDTKRVEKNAGIDKFVLLNIATKPKQQKNINDWTISLLDDDMVIPFGSIHPLCDNKIAELNRIKKAGIKGIKLHPEYQSFYPDDSAMDEVYDECGRLGLIVLFHAGVDLGLTEMVHATPERLKRTVIKHPKTTFVAAHMGGFDCWEGVLKNLCGLANLYLDTSYCAKDLPHDTAMQIIDAHGADKILFASDLPWEDPTYSLAMINSLNISKEDKQKILGENAKKLLAL